MNILVILAAAVGVLVLGGRFYAPVIGRGMGERNDRETPAVSKNDGRDFVPTGTPVVFAHHFASIAGAMPIVGPVVALLYGWVPAILWVVFGCVFLGAVHDYASTHVAMREGGMNLTVIAQKYVGKSAFLMMLLFLVAILVLVCAVFLDLSALALTSMVPVDVLKLPADQNLFRVQDGQAIIGGIASSSVIVITMFSPLIGYLYLRKNLNVWVCSLLAVIICGISIVVGLYHPVAVTPFTWKMIISGYVLLSAGVPVWLFLQSRDFINVHILYAGMVFLFLGLVAFGLGGHSNVFEAGTIPTLNWEEGSERIGPGWPMMFVLIACGAVSGFHSLCAGGTTCKQLKTELAARRVGYYAMLLEGLLAVIVICVMVSGLNMESYRMYCYPEGSKGNPTLTFAMAVGHIAHEGLGLPMAAGALGAMLVLEGFLVTTLDTAIRLTRYMLEEAWRILLGPAEEAKGVKRIVVKILGQYWINSGLAVGLMLLLALTNGYSAVIVLFGTANQLLAAIALLICTTWLLKNKRPIWYTLWPMVFMLVTTITMMVWLLVTDYIPNMSQGVPGKIPLFIADVVVLSMAIGLLVLTVRQWFMPTTVKTE